MFRIAQFFVFIAIASGISTKCRNEEDCLEKMMHPDLLEPLQLRSSVDSAENGKSFWLNNAYTFVNEVSKRKRNLKKAKNVIFFVGGGMGLSTLSATRALKGGEQEKLSFEEFPDVGMAKPYSLDYIVPDSASTATAYLCGVKGNRFTIGVNGHVRGGDCEAMQNETNHVYSIAQWAIDIGKSVGIVTTSRVTHPSPAGAYAHSAHRDWENDVHLKESCGTNSKIKDIAHQLVHGRTGKDLKVIFGGGYREFMDKSIDPRGVRSDGRNLIKEWTEAKPNSLFVDNLDDFEKIDVKSVDRVMGLFADSHMAFNVHNSNRTEPRLKDMTEKAIQLLQQDGEGYFLLVNAGKIDTAHHKNQARLALDETLQLSEAIQYALRLVNDETLIVVSSDHSNTLTESGYAKRRNDIFGYADGKGKDKKSYLTLSYANGPSFDEYHENNKHERKDPLGVNNNQPDSYFPSTLKTSDGTNAGEDVAVFAKGPYSHLFTGVYEQNVIPHLIAYAACWGEHQQMCD